MGKSVFNLLTNVTGDPEFSGEKPDDIIRNTFKFKNLGEYNFFKCRN